MRVTNFDNPYKSLCNRPLLCCSGGVQEFEFCSEGAGRVVSKLKQGQITPLQDVTSEHLELRAGSGLKAANAMDVGVRAPGSTGPRWGNAPETAGDVPVRYAFDGLGPGLVRSVEQAEQKEEP